jgi:2-dehydro-3-deoxyphosphogluconate aldolase/(4S)-4-hydroxy-2-oxoglutarate aldolase
MNKEQVGRRIEEIGIVPVVRASSSQQARAAAEAVWQGGIPVVEITMTVPGAVEVIRTLVKAMPEVLVGAGTVLDVESARACLDAGAKFLVSPGLDLPTVEFAVRQNILMIAGALTPTEVIAAWKAGSSFVKIFPCGHVGGAKYIKALKGPLPQVPLIPTGGVNLETAADYLRAGAAALGVGGELVSATALKSGNTSPITEAARKYVAIVREVRQPPASVTAVR